MGDQDPELDRLVTAERVTFDRCQRLKGFSAEVQAAAEALWQEAAQAVRDYRAKHRYWTGAGRLHPGDRLEIATPFTAGWQSPP